MPAPPQSRGSARMFASGDLPKGLDRAMLRRAWKFATPYKKLIALSLVTIVAAAGVAVLPPLVFKRIIDDAIPNQDFGLVNIMFVAAVALAISSTALNVFNRWISAMIGEGLIYDLRVRLYDHVQKMPIGFFTRTQTGSLLSRLNNDVVGAQATVTTATTVVSDLITLTVTFVAMIALSWQVTFLALLIIPIFVFLDRVVGRRLIDISRKRMETNADMTTTMQERFNVSGALLVKLFGRPNEELQRFGLDADRVKAAGIRQALMTRVYFGVLALSASLGTALVYWLGGRSVIEGAITIGTLTALAAYVARLYEPLTSIANARVELLTALVSFERCFEVLDTPATVVDRPNATPLTNPRGRIEFDRVWFRYPPPKALTIASLESITSADETAQSPSDWILRDLSLSAEPGETVALVGHSGAGKTTLSSLVSRSYDVDEGAIRIDGHDVRELQLQSLSDAIGVVSQDTHLFHDTIAMNLRYARPDATDVQLVEACKKARIHNLIAQMPDGYSTVVGERGYRLSGGEKQRLAIARVLLKQPAIVVLDEATAHLDSETESLIQQALTEALAGRTALVIAHRLSTIRTADKIVVLDQGEVRQVGTHEQLIGEDGLYRELYRTQYAQND
jgi:ATP-binding cassette, subfamily B, bacterial